MTTCSSPCGMLGIVTCDLEENLTHSQFFTRDRLVQAAPYGHHLPHIVLLQVF